MLYINIITIIVFINLFVGTFHEIKILQNVSTALVHCEGQACVSFEAVAFI